MSEEPRYTIENHMLRWRRWNQIGTGEPKEPVCLVGKLIKAVPDVDDYDPLSDDEAEEVNKALLMLKDRHPKLHEAIVMRYQFNFEDKFAAKKCGCSDETLRQRRKQGHTFLDAALFAKYYREQC